VEPPYRGSVQPRYRGRGLDKIIEGDNKTGEKLIDQAEKIDPKEDEELAEEVKRDRENAERFVERQ